jgi:ABC-2 type transport system permease protein
MKIPMWWASLHNESIKILAKPRSYLGFLAITLLVGVILLALALDGQSYLDFVTGSLEQNLMIEGSMLNGHLVGFIVLQMLVVHLPLLVALVTGDLISGEAAMGTLRNLVTRPLPRKSMLLSKYGAAAVYTMVLLFWLGLMAVGVAQWIFGPGDLAVLSGEGLQILPSIEVMPRFLQAFALAFMALYTVACLSVTFSCLADNSIGPIVGTMALIMVFTLIGTLDVPLFDNIRPFLFTTHMAAWRSLFLDPIPWDDIWFSVGLLTLHCAVLMTFGLWYFDRKDILT